MRTLPGLLIAILTLTACATLPSPIDEPAAGTRPDVATARENPEQTRGEVVRWGGTIAGVENQPQVTLIEVVARELDRGGRPRATDISEGRFLAVIPGFLDPAIYQRGRQLTVVGELHGIRHREVGDLEYPYPEVRVTGHHLWEPRPEPPAMGRYPGPYFHDPFYDPFYDPFHRPGFGPRFHDPFYRHPFPHHRW